MAGLSSRFFKAGYDRPKWMLPLAGRTLFDWSLLSFSDQFETEEFLIVFREEYAARAFIEERVHKLGIKRVRLVALKAPTLGQADTVALGLSGIGANDAEPIIIFNIDTIRPGFRKTPSMTDSAGWLECFNGEGDHWSFVKEDAQRRGMAEKVVEKRRISDNCCTGMYYFSSCELFDRALAAERTDPSMPELYIAPLYQKIIDWRMPVSFDIIGQSRIFFSGSPDEYIQAQQDAEALVQSFGLTR